MVTFTLTLIVGVVAGVVATLRDGRPLKVTVLVGLLGAYAGALIGLVAGETIQGIAAAFPWNRAGTGVGAVVGAMLALAFDRRLQPPGRWKSAPRTERREMPTLYLLPPQFPR
jgi:xanthosine utilization system XapX-like protein